MSQALLLSLLGIGITFLALGSLILIIFILRWLFRSENTSSGAAEDERKRRQLAVAIAVAVCLQDDDRKQDLSLGQRLESPPGPWQKR